MKIENALRKLDDNGLTVIEEDGTYSAYTNDSAFYIRFNTVTHTNAIDVHKKIGGRPHTKKDSIQSFVDGMIGADFEDITQAINYVLSN